MDAGAAVVRDAESTLAADATHGDARVRDGSAHDGPFPLEAACAAPQGTFGSCTSGSACSEPASEQGKSAIAICISELGDRLRKTPCWTWEVRGRCYDPRGQAWIYWYEGDPATLESQCEQGGGVFCPHAPGHGPEKRAACEAACAGEAPDYASEPECQDVVTQCVPSCEEAMAEVSEICATCLAPQLFWPLGGCNDWECYCPGPEWPTPEAAGCQHVCP
jgi:hypothetical protein